METQTNVAPADLEIKSLGGTGYKLRDWLTSYPFLLVAIDPYTAESSWILDSAVRIFDHFSPADIRVGFVCTAEEAGCKEFLGPLAERYMTIGDPDRNIVTSFGLQRLPGLVHVRADGYLQTADGWDPKTWSSITDWVATILAWSKLSLGVAGEPSPYNGSPVEG